MRYLVVQVMLGAARQKKARFASCWDAKDYAENLSADMLVDHTEVLDTQLKTTFFATASKSGWATAKDKAGNRY